MKNESRILTAPMLALMALSFTVGFCEYLAVAILPDIAEGLGVSLGAAGKLVSVFAAGYAVGTPVVAAAVSRLPRFPVLLSMLGLFLLANLAGCLAPNLTVLCVSRILAAVLTGSLTVMIMLFVRVTAPERTARAIALVYTSMSLSTVVGNPLGKLLSGQLGWRAAFGVIVLMGACLLPVLARVLPHPAAAGETSSFLRQFAVLRDRRYALCVSMTIFIYGATYVVYTYLTPILTEVLGVGETGVSGLLLAVGLCCMSSNLLAGWLGEHGGLRKLPAVVGLQVLLFALMPLLLGNVRTGIGAVLLMAALMYAASTPVQAFASDLAEREYPFAASLCASTLSVSGNIGIAAGSFASSFLQELLGLRRLGFPAALTALAALGLNLLLLRACAAKQNPV